MQLSTQSNIKKQSPSAKNQENTNSTSTNTPNSQDSSSSKLYRSILKMPLQAFVNCLCFHNYDQIVYEGDPASVSVKDKMEAWVEVYREYVSEIGDASNTMYMNIVKEVTLLEVKINIVEKGVDFLKTFMDRHHIFSPENQNEKVKEVVKNITDAINEQLNTIFEFDITERNRFIKTLDRCLTRIKSEKILHAQKSEVLKGMQKTMDSKSDKPTEEYFYSSLYALSDHAGFRLSMEEITVHEYCQRVKALNKHIEQLNNGKATIRSIH